MGEVVTPSGEIEELYRGGWKQDPDAVRANILEVAREVFAEKGLSGARIQEIAALTKTSKRMIYYYFGDKEGLYRAALEEAYQEMRRSEDALDLTQVPPVEALRQLAEFTFDHHRNAVNFVRLVTIENIHHGEHMQQSDGIVGQNSSAIRLLENIYARGCELGLFRRGLTALELHWHISALCYFNVSNRATFSRIFGDDLFQEKGQQMLRRHVGDMILRFVMRTDTDKGRTVLNALDDGRKINPGILKFLDVWDGKWATLAPGATPADRRLKFEAIAREMRLETPPGIETDDEHWIDSEGGPVRVRIFRHSGGGSQAALIYMHGGGFMQGSPETHWDITSRIAAWNRQTVISVDYSLAPEHPYPLAFQQCVAVVEWARDNAASLGIDPARLAVGGDSAGGNLAAVTALKGREIGLPLRAQMLVYPVCDFDRSRPSYSENANGPLLRVAGMAENNALYCADVEKLNTDPFIAPLAASSHAGLPPAFVAVAQYDPLRDSGRAYADAVKTAGGDVTVDDGAGLIHGYLRALEYCPESETALRRMCAWLKEKCA
ncbi:MAG: alpha/beta hydrolase fold domain-containing protein [Nisaea sp.]|uniref:alpha/beta hydrolase fold domain-containing protein n=1 Tax=Nisaea sp. TaxID=2024842 RepID=UPI001B1A84A5|nr:alpha/beta hydrolase fold domain-containing protein [Nisaea sp.]MBO6560170.1 alpha/beta hydrolase fold domain-containing protein [Nisaea sp.]